VRSAFQSEKPQIVWCDTSDSSRSAVLQAGTVCPQGKKRLPEERSARYGRVAIVMTIRSRCGFSGETQMGRAFAGHPPCFDWLIWNDQTARADRFATRPFLPAAKRTWRETALAEATPAEPAKTPSRPCRVIQRFPRSGRHKKARGSSSLRSLR